MTNLEKLTKNGAQIRQKSIQKSMSTNRRPKINKNRPLERPRAEKGATAFAQGSVRWARWPQAGGHLSRNSRKTRKNGARNEELGLTRHGPKARRIFINV